MAIKLGTIIKNVIEVIPRFKKLPVAQRNWLIKLYHKSYRMGENSIASDVFTNPGYVTTQALLERLKAYPEVSVHETEFMKELAEGNEESLNAILDETEELEDFVYSMYEENYSDWVPKAVNKMLTKIPEDLKQYDLDLLAQEAFANGILWQVDYYAKQEIIKYAKKVVDKEEGGEDDGFTNT